VNRQKALDALDDAFKDRLSKLFDNFSSHEAIEDVSEVAKQFETSFDNSLDAYGRAATVIEKKFPE
jgi:hypothetical protein